MPAFLVTYTSPTQRHERQHETEWIAPCGFDTDRARESFERHCPSAAVVRVEEID